MNNDEIVALRKGKSQATKSLGKFTSNCKIHGKYLANALVLSESFREARELLYERAEISDLRATKDLVSKHVLLTDRLRSIKSQLNGEGFE